MTVPISDDDLESGLDELVGTPGRSRFTLVSRSPNPYASTAASEVVVGELDGAEVEVICKWEVGEPGGDLHHHGLAHEERVYREILAPLGVTTPRCFGSISVADPDRRCLVLEYLRTSLRVSKLPPHQGITPAAGWLGRFHRRSLELGAELPAWLPRYEVSYYVKWARQTAEFAERLGRDSASIEALAAGEDGRLHALTAVEQVVIHGECYPHNLLATSAGTHLIDWETCAVGPGEIDLAALLEGWPGEIRAEAEREYASARWPDGAPASFSNTLALADLYLTLRWLGDRFEWSAGERSLARWERLDALLGPASLAEA